MKNACAGWGPEDFDSTFSKWLIDFDSPGDFTFPDDDWWAA
jgi:hypothetical protein